MWQPLVILENWAVVDSVVSHSYQELRPGKHLTGTVLAPANLPDANFIFTSPIVGVDSDKGVVHTRNTIYQLGEANHEYKTWDRERRGAAARRHASRRHVTELSLRSYSVTEEQRSDEDVVFAAQGKPRRKYRNMVHGKSLIRPK
jgi:hypothetical protein